MSSREKRHQVIDLLLRNASENPDNYIIYIVACVVAWHFKDSPNGMSTINQIHVYNYVHVQIDQLHRNYPTAEVAQAHDILHELGAELEQKAIAKGIIKVDDGAVPSDDALLEKHSEDFTEWAKELNLPEEK